MKKALCFFSLIFFYQIVYSQAPVIEWQNTIGGSGSDELITIVTSTDGGYVCAGNSSSAISGDKTENCLGLTDYWIIKLDSLGVIQWQNTIGGSNHDYLTSFHQTMDGGFICGGTSYSNISGDKTENCSGDYDFWVIKLDSSGNIQWQQTIGGSYGDALSSICQTADGGYICGGFSYSDITGDKTDGSQGDSDYWIVKLDSLGDIQWQNDIGGSKAEGLKSISQTFDGGYICGGSSFSGKSGDKTEYNFGDCDYWILKLDSLGNIQWQKDIKGDGKDQFTTISQTIDGGYICGGSSESHIFGDKSENNIGDYYDFDYWIIKFDSSGNIVWENTIGGRQDDGHYYNISPFISVTLDGGYLCGGTSNSGISGDKTENCLGGISDCWLFKLDSTGKMQWQNSFGGSLWDKGYCSFQTNDGGYIYGAQSGSDISGDKSENCLGAGDYWILKLTNEFNSISGKLFLDFNSNSIQDNGEPPVPNKMISLVNTGIIGFSDDSGLYTLNVINSGNFVVETNPFTYYNPNPTSCAAYFSGIKQTDSLNDFAFQPTGTYNDLKIKLTPLGGFTSGFNAFYQLDYQNIGTTTLNGNVVFYMDPNLTYVNSTLIPASITIDSITWNTASLSPFQGGSIIITVLVNSITPIGTLIHPISKIFPIAGDAIPQDNSSSWEVAVTGSFDPNDIVVNRKKILSTDLPNPPWLEYIIRFQNTGNDTAINVKILNPIDSTMLQLNTIEMISSSHPYHVQYNDWERNMQFTFDNVQLPDSAINEPASHGFIRYRIKPKTTLVLNDKIKNQAFIYFDFNYPVATDTAVTKIVLPAGISDITSENEKGLILFPNPASEAITIQLTNPKESLREIKIHDLLGQTIFENQLETKNITPKTTLNLSGVSSGIYLVEVLTGITTYRGRVLKK